MAVPGGAVAAILAGGRATRLGGACKPLLEIAGRRILDRQLDVLRPRFSEIILISSDPAPFAGHHLRVVADREPGLGPLGGIATALRETGRELFIVAGDLPLLDPRAIEALYEAGDGDADAVVFETARGLEPLHARWFPSALPFVEEAIGSRRLAVHEVQSNGDALPVLENVNTPEDVTRLSRLLAALPTR